jgi:hypothetical protein
MLNKKLLFFMFFSCTLLQGQIGGKSIFPFLNLVASPRQAALGGKPITIYDEDVNQVHFNPATLNVEMDNHLSLNYGSLFNEVSYGTASYAYTYDRHLQTLQIGLNYVNYGKFDGYDSSGVATATFTGSEIAMSLGYAYSIPNTKIHIGTNVKLISSALENYTSFGGAVDIGVIYINESNDTNWGLVIRNIGTQFTTYSGTNEKFPLEITAGVSQQLENVPIRWHFTFENLQQWNLSFSNPERATTTIDGVESPEKVSFINNTLRHTVLGIELFPKRAFNIRLGYNFRRSQELKILEQRSFSGISLGFGLKMNKLKFNYSYSKYTLAGNTSLFGLIIDFHE